MLSTVSGVEIAVGFVVAALNAAAAILTGYAAIRALAKRRANGNGT